MSWDLYRDGITQTMLKKWLTCRERFRLYAILGLQEPMGFNKKMEYGSLIHAGLEHLEKKGKIGPKRWSRVKRAINAYADKIVAVYPSSRDEIHWWARIAYAELRSYAEHWKADRLTDKSETVSTEQVFHVPIELPSGRGRIPLRGRWDRLFTETRKSTNVSSRKVTELWLQENKALGSLDEEALLRTLHLDLQTMFYLSALDASGDTRGTVSGVLYNVLRRPLAQKHCIRQKKTETKEEFTQRLIEIIHTHPEDFFYRWRVHVTRTDLRNFRERCLIPMLEALTDWYDYIRLRPNNPWGMADQSVHFLRPFGIVDGYDFGVTGDYFNLMTSEDNTGLVPVNSYFPELED